MALVGLQFKNIGLKRIRFITVPFVYSTAQPGRVEWTEDADTLWKRIANDQPLGKLRVGSIGADQVPSGSGTPSDDPSSAESPSDDPTTSESPTDTASPTDEPTDSIDATDDDLAFAGLCT